MKIIQTLIFITLLTLTSCTLDGVKNNNNDNSDTIDTTSNAIINNDLLDVPQIKSDSINGTANNMVWNGEKGLRVEWDIKGEKQHIKNHDVILVNYSARVARGDVYDSNSEIGHPVPLKLGIGQLIEGWELGLLQMQKGDKGRIMIPSKLGYGEQGLIGVVPQNADIIVDIEIIDLIEPIVLDDNVKLYKYETVSEGLYPQKNQTITFDYFAFNAGTKNGMYDNSYEKGNPFSFNFENDNVIDGLHIGFSQLKANEKAYIHIPSKAAYGSKGLVDLVPSNTDIVFDVRVESIK